MNKILLMGRAVKKPEVRISTTNIAVGRVTLAVDRRYKQEGGQTADFISCLAFGKTAEFLEKYVNKGTKIVVEGRWQTGSYEKDGKNVYTNDCVIESIEFAESKKQEQEQNTTPPPEPAPCGDGFMNIPDGIDAEELPFQ